jgi:hypothetical protein
MCVARVHTVLLACSNGRWTSQWEVVVNAREGEAQMSAHVFGGCRVSIHYFEDGNIQLSSDYSGSMDVVGEDPDALGTAIVAAIAGAEALYLKELEVGSSPISPSIAFLSFFSLWSLRIYQSNSQPSYPATLFYNVSFSKALPSDLLWPLFYCLAHFHYE